MLRKLEPSHIITEGMLHFSGLSLEDAEEILERDGLSRCRLVDIYPISVKEVFRGIRMIAQIFGFEQKGDLMVEECRKKLKRTARKFGVRRNEQAIAVIRDWPFLHLAGRWLSDLIEMAGALPVIHGDDVFIHPDSYFEEQPSLFLVGRPYDSLEENRKNAVNLESDTLASVFACENDPSFIAVDGPVFYDHSCTGLDTALKILGEILKNDPDLYERKGVFWDRLEL
jgi:hypothetical protein